MRRRTISSDHSRRTASRGRAERDWTLDIVRLEGSSPTIDPKSPSPEDESLPSLSASVSCRRRSEWSHAGV